MLYKHKDRFFFFFFVHFQVQKLDPVISQKCNGVICSMQTKRFMIDLWIWCSLERVVGDFYCIWITSTTTTKKVFFGTSTLTEVLIVAELWSRLRAKVQQQIAEKCIAPTLPLLMLQMDGVLGRKGDDFWQQGTEMTALHLWRATQGLGSKHLLRAPDRALMPS